MWSMLIVFLFYENMSIHYYMYMSPAVLKYSELIKVSLPSTWRAHANKVASFAVGKFMCVIIRNVCLLCHTRDL